MSNSAKVPCKVRAITALTRHENKKVQNIKPGLIYMETDQATLDFFLSKGAVELVVDPPIVAAPTPEGDDSTDESAPKTGKKKPNDVV